MELEMDSRRENVAQEKKKEEGIDLVKDDNITKIFSLLPTEDNVRASFVCKRWKSLTSFPLSVLDLDCKRFCKFFKNSTQEAQKKKFTDFVNAMFVPHDHDDHRHLEEFRLALDLSLFGVINPEIDNWVFCAMTSDSAKLDLEFTRVNEFGGGFKLYKLPRFVDVIRSVTVLKLSHCNFLPLYYSRFESLQTVIFRDVALLNNAVNDLIDRCPVLEELHIIYCVVSSQFNISASTSKLKCLVLDCLTGSEGRLDSVYISVPSLLKFKYVGELLKGLNFHVSYLDNLIEAYIFFGEGGFSIDHKKSLHTLMGSLRNVNTLTLCSWSLEVLGLGTILLSDPSKSHENLPYPLSNLKHLTLHSCLRDSELQGLHRLLRSSPYIETLSVKLSPRDYSNNFGESHAVHFDCLQYLKEIEIKDFHGLEGEIKFLTDILANPLVVLEKIIIYKAAFRSSYNSKEQDEILFFAKQEKAIKVLLDFTRASPELRYYSDKGFCSWVRS